MFQNYIFICGVRSVAKKSEYKTVRKHTRSLLDGSEDEEVDFKKSVSSLENIDLVAFSNSPTGGYILIGVDEVKTGKNLQRGKIIGCTTSDRNKRKILDKAGSCRPSIKAEVVVENTNDKPFFHVHIPSGEDKPYCTSGGTYKIRDNGRNRSLTPKELLAMFLSLESDKFIERFREATEELSKDIESLRFNLSQKIKSNLTELSSDIEDHIHDTKNNIAEGLESILSEIEDMDHYISQHLSSIYDHVENANHLADDAMAFSEETLGGIRELEREVGNVQNSLHELHSEVDLLSKVLTEELGVSEKMYRLRWKKDIKKRIRYYVTKLRNEEGIRDKVLNIIQKWLDLRKSDASSEKQQLITYAEEHLEQWYEEIFPEFESS